MRHERCFAYSAQTACDKHGFVLDFEVGAGNVHDGQMFHELYKKMDLSRTQIVAVDAGYKTPGVVREILRAGKFLQCPILAPRPRTVFSENPSMFTMNILTVTFVHRIIEVHNNKSGRLLRKTTRTFVKNILVAKVAP